MGKIILCAGKRAVNPFIIRMSGIKIYTMEELCYYVYNNIETAGEELYRGELVTFIREELGLHDRADFIDKLRKSKAGIKDIAVSILCSTDYYTEKEIMSLIAEIDILSSLKPVQRLKRSADKLMKTGDYKQASILFLRIRNGGEMGMLTTDEQGEVIHNAAVSDAASGAFMAAAEGFKEAYEKSHNKESLKQYLFALKFLKQDELYNLEMDRHIRIRSIINELEDEYKRAEESYQYMPGHEKIREIENLYKDGFIKEYSEKKNEIISELKMSLRKD